MLQYVRWALVATTAVTAMGVSEARAEFWNSLQSTPPPNLILGLDRSVTMGIFDSGGGGCGPGCHSPTRLQNLASEIQTTLPMIRDYFNVGYYEYSGCGYARIRTGSRILPGANSLGAPAVVGPPALPATPGSVMARLGQLGNGSIGNCGSREGRFPPPATGNGCFTATNMCSGDLAELGAILDGTSPVAGLTIPPPAYPGGILNESALACEDGSFIDVQAQVQGLLNGTTWPRFGGANPTNPLTPGQILTRFCAPLTTVLTNMRTTISTCLPSDPLDSTSSVIDFSFLSGSYCDALVISGSLCQGGSNLAHTCSCDDSDPLCLGSGGAVSSCGEPLSWRARQQVAVCEAYEPTGFFGTYFASQVDNIVRGNNPNTFCRENVSMFLTDGWEGHRIGVDREATNALNPGMTPNATYRSADGLSNMFVLRSTNVFQGDADGMSQYLDPVTNRNSFSGSTQTQVQGSMASILNRIYKGVYAGANFGMDTNQTRAVFHTFTVPGYDGSNSSSGTNATDDYLGYPTRLSTYQVLDDGSLGNLLYETDWANRMGNVPGCGPTNWDGTSGVVGSFAAYQADMGPGGTFSNGVNRTVTLNGNSDRSGDGVNDATPQPIVYGRSYGFAHTTPLVVERPRDAINAIGDMNAINAYKNFISQPQHDQRPRALYSMDGGYVIGYHGGAYQPGFVNYGTGANGTLTLSNAYNDASTAAGREIFRYRPSWVDDVGNEYTYTSNPTIQQPLMTGQLATREVYVPTHTANGALSDRVFSVLVGNQGREGRGLFVADISNPCSPPAFVNEFTLPGANDRASADPAVYAVRVPNGGAPEIRPMLITTSGLAGRDARGVFQPAGNMLYMYDITNGSNTVAYQIALPPGPAVPSGERPISWPTKPVCLDASGKGSGAITHCYVLRSDGYMASVEVATDGVAAGFTGAPFNVTAQDAGGAFVAMAPNRRFYTAPVAYFGSRGDVNLVFGSGDFEDLTGPDAANVVVKMRDARFGLIPQNKGDVENVCVPAAGTSQQGIFPMPASNRVLSSPTVSDGVVAWTTYETTNNGCTSGNGYLYAIDFEKCTDVMAPGNPPTPQNKGAGIPTSPVVHRQSDKIIVQTSEDVLATQADDTAVASTRSGTLPVLALPTYWRLELKIP